MIRPSSLVLAVILCGSAAAGGCYPTYASGGSYAASDQVSATATTVESTLEDCAPAGESGCPASGKTTTTKNRITTFNYTCREGPTSNFCSQGAFAPGGQYSSTAWTKESGACEGAATPASAVTPAIWIGGSGCPKAFVADTDYDAGDFTSVGTDFNMVYQCAAAPNNLFCGASGYAPGVGLHWEQAWTSLGTCTGDMAPTISPVYNALAAAGGCPDAFASVMKYEDGDRVSKLDLVYQCKAWPYSVHCSQPGYEPGTSTGSGSQSTEFWKNAWMITGYCNGSIVPTTAPQFTSLANMGGCPEAWKIKGAADLYEEGDRVTSQGLVYQCKAWPMNAHCGQAGYEPSAGATVTWKTAWAIVGYCSGTIGPTGSPAIDPTESVGACADTWTSRTNMAYEEGDTVSVTVSAVPERKVSYKCKAWPYSGYCSKFNPTMPGGDLGWILAGSCEGSMAPTGAPIVYSGSCKYTKDVTLKSTGIITPTPTPVNSWGANIDYVAGDVVRLDKKRFKCKEWPYHVWCRANAYQPTLAKDGIWANAWTEDGVCNTELDAAECIYQRDFTGGTKVITKSGGYKLCEDIVFAPGEPNVLTASDSEIANAFNPATLGGGQYNKKEFALGFFSAIAIAANDVSLMLNGYTIQQGRSHALMQRFFAVIELASSPFIPKVGPADFVSGVFVPAENFVLKGPGTIGLSSHHGIHGNNNKNVAIDNVIFRDFEVAAVSLNNVDGLIIDNCNIPHNRLDVPILGAFSAALFMAPYLKALKDVSQPYSMQLRGVSTSSTTVYDSLVTAIANVYKDVMLHGFINPIIHPEEYALFHNPHHVVDGPCYAFLVHGKGPAIGGQGFELSKNSTATSSNVKISNNNIEQMICWTNEVPSAVINGVVQNDARGSIIQLISTVTNSWLASDASNHYTGNIVTDAQIMVASAIHDGVLQQDPILQIGVNTIAPEIIAWAIDPSAVFVPSFRCNGDTMHHVVKGSIMIRVEDTEGFHIKGNTIGSALVKSGPAATSSEYFSSFPGTQLQWACTDFHKGASVEDGSEQQLGNLRGISVAAVSQFVQAGESTISGNALTKFESEFANSIVGIDIQGMSTGILVSGNYVNLKQGAGINTNDQYIACRVRRFVSQKNIVKTDNVFFQEEIFEQVPDRRLRSRKMPAHHPSVETEWDYGGCPFGRV